MLTIQKKTTGIMMPVSGTGQKSGDLLLEEPEADISDLYPNNITLCGQSDQRIVGQLLKIKQIKLSQSVADASKSEEEGRVVKLANAIVSLGDGKGERFYRRLVCRLSW